VANDHPKDIKTDKVERTTAINKRIFISEKDKNKDQNKENTEFVILKEDEAKLIAVTLDNMDNLMPWINHIISGKGGL